MALVPNRGTALARRVTFYSLGTTVVAALLFGLIISSLLGWIVLIIGLIVSAAIWLNFRSVMRVRGMR